MEGFYKGLGTNFNDEIAGKYRRKFHEFKNLYEWENN